MNEYLEEISDDRVYLLKLLLPQVKYSKKLKPIPIKYSKIYDMLYTSDLIHDLTEFSRLTHFKFEKGYDSNIFIEYFLPNIAFLFLCRHHFQSYAEELFELGDVNSACMGEALKMTVSNGDLKKAKWLRGLFKASVEELSRCLCICAYEKNFEFMKWLLSVSYKTCRNDFLQTLRWKKYEGYKDVRLFVREWEKNNCGKNETNNSLIQTSDSEKQFIPPKPKVNISYRKKYTPTAKMIKFWGLDEKTKLSFIDIRKKFKKYIETNELNKNNTIKTDEKINFILGIMKNMNINISYLDNIVMHFFEDNV